MSKLLVRVDCILEERLHYLIDKVKKYTVLFSFSILSGLIINLGVMIYNCGNGDTIKWSIYQYDFAHERSSGRWMLQVLAFMRNGKVIPLFTTVLSILFLSIAVVIIIDAIGLSNKYFRGIFSLLFLASPYVNSYLYIYYTSDAYCLGILIATIIAWLLIKCNSYFSYSLAAVLIMVDLAIYQATMNVFIPLFCIGVLINSTGTSIRIKDQLEKLLKVAATGCVGLILYFLSLKLCFVIFGGHLVAYKGLDSIGVYDKSIVMGMIKNYIWHIALMYFLPNDYVSSSVYYSKAFNGTIINAVVFLLIFVLLIRKLVHISSKKNKAWSILCLLVTCMMWSPIIFASQAFSAPDANTTMINSLVSPQFSFLYLLLFMLLEQEKNIKGKFIINFATCIMTLFMVFNLCLAINEAYYGNQLAWNYSERLALRILDRIEQTEGWYEGMPIAFYGALNGDISENYPTQNNEIRYTNMPFMWDGQTQLGWQKFLIEYFGVKYQQCDKAFFDTFIDTEEYRNMDTFPANNSVGIYDGVMVVKISD